MLLCGKCDNTKATRIIEHHGPICESCAEKVWTYEKEETKEKAKTEEKVNVPEFFRESAVDIAKHMTKYEDD